MILHTTYSSCNLINFQYPQSNMHLLGGSKVERGRARSFSESWLHGLVGAAQVCLNTVALSKNSLSTPYLSRDLQLICTVQQLRGKKVKLKEITSKSFSVQITLRSTSLQWRNNKQRAACWCKQVSNQKTFSILIVKYFVTLMFHDKRRKCPLSS